MKNSNLSLSNFLKTVIFQNKLTSELVKQLCGSSRFRRLFLGDGDVGVGGGMTPPAALCLNTVSLSLCSGDDESLLNRFKLMSGACADDGVDGA